MADSSRVELLTVGDELLLGIRTNGHLAWLGDQLSRFGMPLTAGQVVRDQAGLLETAFAEAWARSNVVITTGGLGPTSDDNTREVIAAVLGRSLVLDREVEQKLEQHYRRRGRPLTDATRRQCYRFEGSTALYNRNGTAPGLLLEDGGKLLIMLPGPRVELRTMFLEEVLPLLRSMGYGQTGRDYLQLRTTEIGESAVQERLQPLFADYTQLTVGYCAHEGLVDVRLAGLPEDELLALGKRCRQELGEDFVCFGNRTLAEIVTEQLRAMEKTLALAESCTGGLLSSAFTDIAGASKVFVGGLVCYRNDAKVQMLDVPESILQQHGAVSAETAVAMVMGAAERFSSDYALSITGFAGPGGGSEENPVGTIYMGYYAPSGVWSRRLVLPGERVLFKGRAVNAGLDWMRRKMIRYKVEDYLTMLED